MYGFLSTLAKVDVVNIDRRQTYRDLFGYANEHLSGKIVVVSNTDILFDNSVSRVREVDWNPSHLLALTRWEPGSNGDWKLTLQPRMTVAWSFDSYVFKSPLKCNLTDLEIKVGLPGCDNYLLKKLCYDNLVTVENPCLDIKTFHIDYYERVKTYHGGDETYYYRVDYPGTWNKAFHGTVKGVPCKTASYYGVPVTGLGHSELKYDSSSHLLPARQPAEDLPVYNLRLRRKVKVVAFSLWGADDTYNTGAVENARLVLEHYPMWEAWFYVHTPSVPVDTVEKLKKYPHVRIIDRKELTLPYMWRFEPIDDPDVTHLLSRDTDTRILRRERRAVDEWLTSGKSFHIMRDHPHHSEKILAGMFGTKKIRELEWKPLFRQVTDTSAFNYDQVFLRTYIYPKVAEDSLVHTSFHSFAGECVRPFPDDYEDLHHVGEYVYSDNSRSSRHMEVMRSCLQV
jgi:hypothetical protein